MSAARRRRLSCGDGDLWMFEQSGQKLVAVNINDEPQVIDIDVGGNFAASGGSPPRATNVKQIGDFLFLSGLAAGGRAFPSRQQSLHYLVRHQRHHGWTTGTNLCDMQELPDGGPVQGVAGGEIGYVRAGSQHQNTAIPARRYNVYFQFLPRAG